MEDERLTDNSPPDTAFDDLDAIDVDVIVDPSVDRLKLDPACIAMRVQLSHALKAGDTTIEEAGRDGTVILVILPAEAWTAIARDVWRTWIRNGERYMDGRRIGYQYDEHWVAFFSDEEPRSREQENAAENFARSVSNGLHCVGFAADVT
jgi:hypothetical protein